MIHRRTLTTAWLASVVVGGLGAGWFVTGYRAARREEAQLVAAARTRAHDRAQTLAAELGRRLGALLDSEDLRPYYHYGNLFHDPRGAHQGVSVTPSPLADRPGDPLIAVHFQVDARGRVTVPPVNDDEPSLSNPIGLADNQRWLAALKAAAPSLGGPSSKDGHAPPVVAVGPKPSPPRPEDAPTEKVRRTKVKEDDGAKPTDAAKPSKVKSARVDKLEASAYLQNFNSTVVFKELQGRGDPGAAPKSPRPASQQASQQAMPPASQQAPQQAVLPPAPSLQASQPAAPSPAALAPPRPRPAPRRLPSPRTAAPPAAMAGPAALSPTGVAIKTEPLLFRTVVVDGKIELAALRQVETPDGILMQGFLIGPSAVSAWLGERADPELPAVLIAGGGEDALESALVPGLDDAWLVGVDPAPALTAAAAEAARTARGFWRTYLPLAALGLGLGVLLVLQVARAERLARQRSQFAAAAAHELRTPLAGLQLYGEMLADGLGHKDRSETYARHVATEAGRLGRVVANVLGFTQLERGALALTPGPGDLAEAARLACARAEPMLSRAGVPVSLALPERLPARFDADAVARVLQNLLDNAEKHGRGGSDRSISITGRRVDDRVELAVVDRGAGVDRRTARRLFSPFVRGRASEAAPGLGLGLALARALCRAMDGDLEHRATPGGGATFVLSLPALGSD